MILKVLIKLRQLWEQDRILMPIQACIQELKQF